MTQFHQPHPPANSLNGQRQQPQNAFHSQSGSAPAQPPAFAPASPQALSQQRNTPHAQQGHQPYANNAPAQRASTSTPKASAGEDKKAYMSIKSHGKQAAVCVSRDETQGHWKTVSLESAEKLKNGTKEYAWKTKKIKIQITKTELPIVIGVLLGFLPACEFSNHGDENKNFSIENQDSNVFIRVGNPAKKQFNACPVPFVEAHLMGMLALAEYVKNFDGMDCSTAFECIKHLCQSFYAKGAYPGMKRK